jgi:hypothetical protein
MISLGNGKFVEDTEDFSKDGPGYIYSNYEDLGINILNKIKDN